MPMRKESQQLSFEPLGRQSQEIEGRSGSMSGSGGVSLHPLLKSARRFS